MRVAIAGATGATGSICLQLLLRHPNVSKVVVIGRTKTNVTHTRLSELTIDQLASYHDTRIDAFVSCLGTTMNKAGSKNAFKEIDLNLPVQIATSLKEKGCHSAVILSALGAEADSPVFYSSVKGQMENAMIQICFDSLSLFRPSFIEVKRNEKRTGEKFVLVVLRIASFFLIGPLKQFKPLTALTIAKGVVNVLLKNKPGVTIYKAVDIQVEAGD